MLPIQRLPQKIDFWGNCALRYSLFLLPLPAAGSTAGENQSVGGDGKADFFGINLAAKSGYNGSMNHVGKHCRLQACGIRIHQEKQRIIG